MAVAFLKYYFWITPNDHLSLVPYYMACPRFHVFVSSYISFLVESHKMHGILQLAIFLLCHLCRLINFVFSGLPWVNVTFHSSLFRRYPPTLLEIFPIHGKGTPESFCILSYIRYDWNWILIIIWNCQLIALNSDNIQVWILGIVNYCWDLMNDRNFWILFQFLKFFRLCKERILSQFCSVVLMN